MSCAAIRATRCVDYLQPGPIADQTVKTLSSLDGIEEVTEAVSNGSEWIHRWTGNETAGKTVEVFERINLGLSIPGFISSIGKLRDAFRAYWVADNKVKQDEVFSQTAEEKVAQVGLGTLNKAAKSGMFFNEINFLSLKQGLQVLKTAFWGSLFFIDVLAGVKQYRKANNFAKAAKEEVNIAKRGILEHRVKIAILKVIKSVNSIALASISLVSIVFASLAKGFIFSPVVFLSLSSTWLILHYFSTFYKTMVEGWVEDLKLSQTVPAADRA